MVRFKLAGQISLCFAFFRKGRALYSARIIDWSLQRVFLKVIYQGLEVVNMV
jgi:hypothetical protein